MVSLFWSSQTENFRRKRVGEGGGCFPLCLTSGPRPVELTKEKWNAFFIKSQFPTGPKRSISSEMGLETRIFLNGTTRFGRTRPTGQIGLPPEVVPNIPVGPNRNGPFHLTSARNFRKFWLNGKHPRFLERWSKIPKRNLPSAFPRLPPETLSVNLKELCKWYTPIPTEFPIREFLLTI